MAIFVGVFEIILAILCFLILGVLRSCTDHNGGCPRNWPLIGMLPNLLLNLHRFFDWCVENIDDEVEGSFLFKGPWLGNMDILVTTNPVNVHHVLSANFSNYPKGSEFKEMFSFLGDGIFNSDDDLWRYQRKVAQALSRHKQFQQFMVKTTREKVEKGLLPILENVAEKGLVVDLQDLFQRFTFDVTCILVTGYDPACLSIGFPEVAFANALDDAEQAIFFRHALPQTIWKLQRLLGIGEEKKHSKACKTLNGIVAKIISRKREELTRKTMANGDDEAEVEHGSDLLTALMKEEFTSESPRSSDDNKFLRDMILNLMLAGRDTTSAALSWFFWLIFNHPEVETKIREEVAGRIQESEDQNGWWLYKTEEQRKLVYLHGALCETLRLYPPVPFEHKSPLQPDILPSGHHVHPKMKILINLYTMGRMKSIWGSGCMEFKPERWISERGGIKHEPSYKFLAFNAGPRTCLGKEIAFFQMKASVAAVLHSYSVDVVEGQIITPKLSIILQMKHGVNARITRRMA